jgi:hypothetical protein
MRNVIGTAFISMIVLFVGCSQTHQARKVADASGFLGDYSLLEEGKKGEAQLRYINPAVNFAVYDKILIDPVEVWIGKDSKIPREELQNLASHLQYKIIDKLKEDYVIVNTGGPGVMRISAALTEAKKSKVGLDIVTTIVPQAHLMSGVKRLATGAGSFVGEASVECKVTDSNSGEILASAMDRRTGGKALKGSTDAWNDVEQAIEYWAEKMRQRLQELSSGGE